MREYVQNKMNDELLQSLQQLQPAAADLDRDELMFRAGFQAASKAAGEAFPAAGRLAPRGLSDKSPALWKATTGLMTAATVALAIALARQEPASNAPPVAETAPPVAPTTAENEITEPEAETPPELPPAVSYKNPLLAADPSRNYLALRAAVLTRGVDAWPIYVDNSGGSTTSENRPAPTLYELRNQYLPTSVDRAVEPPEPDETSRTNTSSINLLESVI